MLLAIFSALETQCFNLRTTVSLHLLHVSKMFILFHLLIRIWTLSLFAGKVGLY